MRRVMVFSVVATVMVVMMPRSMPRAGISRWFRRRGGLLSHGNHRQGQCCCNDK
jgi:hypothetical protein